MFTGLEKGKRVLIGGSSPHIFNLPINLLKSGPVIGINRWGADFHCDYWIGLDTGLNWEKYYLDSKPEYEHLPKFLKTLEVPKFMRKPNKCTETFVPPDAGHFFEQAHGDIPTEWNETLKWESSTALAAINLAIVLGAAEVVLFGVDFVGDQRADGTSYHRPDFWAEHKAPINRLLCRFQEFVTIYKTNPASWLECPLLEV